ncbi:MAG: Glutathione import ATP-binding protein GsiA [Paracidovorax wautersii]|uniref:Glutathione import ATP-binding protein GsiA n=1 Tax=Paracidovorax wautersii TaxID=1177982 RepID=A0A7V8FMI7_9BURK|nr:MAG: Glutathione import ATP-binding protein GsiA [Paracidovorax wautersii]
MHIVDPTPATLSVRELSIGYATSPRLPATQVVERVSFELARGQTLALVGQSGSGKSTLALACAGLLPPSGRLLSGSVHVSAQRVDRYTRSQWLPLRGKTIGFIPQDPLSSLDPLQRIGDQIAQSVVLHGVAPRQRARGHVVDLLERVGIASAASRYDAYPHELSGGQLQRVLIAIAIAARPALLIADEPTSALDVTVQKTILDLIASLQQEHALSVLFVTHDLALARDRADTLLVLQDGRGVEHGPVRSVLHSPQHAYTARLIAGAPALSPGRHAASARPSAAGEAQQPAIEVRGLVKRYGASTVSPRALDGVDLSVAAGSIHALVGESGSGKTTAARIVAGLIHRDQGEVHVLGRSVARVPPAANAHAKDLQYVYQNALAAMDPRYTVLDVVEEPLRLHAPLDRAQRRDLVRDMLDQLALPPAILERKPRQISGGQRQRVALARALVLQPRILVLDEPTSALDVSVQAQLIELLLRLQNRYGLTYLFISHDLSLVRQIADDVYVLAGGRLVETGRTAQILHAPTQAYTQRLLEAMPGQSALRSAA